MTRIRDIANILSSSTSMATDAEVTSAISAQFVAGKNKIINGDFGIWQRGTTFSSLSNGSYSADRWVLAANKTTTITQQTFTPGTAPVTGYEGTYYLRTAWSADGTYAAIATRLEDCRLFAGQTVTLSYWAKSNVNVTNNAGWSQYFGSGGSSQISGYADNTTITTSWQRFTYTFTVPSVSGKTIGSSNYFIVQPILIQTSSAATIDVWGVQLEAGSTATNFTTATGTIQGELAACQRYFQRIGNNANPYYMYTCAAVEGTSTLWGSVPLPVTMRTVPSMSATSSGSTFTVLAYGNVSSSAIYLDGAQSSASSIVMGSNTLSGLTLYQSRYIRNLNDSSGTYISLSAEL